MFEMSAMTVTLFRKGVGIAALHYSGNFTNTSLYGHTSYVRSFSYRVVSFLGLLEHYSQNARCLFEIPSKMPC